MKLLWCLNILIASLSAETQPSTPETQYSSLDALKRHYARFVLDLSLTGERLLQGCSGRINRQLPARTFKAPGNEQFPDWTVIGFESEITCNNSITSVYTDVGIYMVPNLELESGQIRTIEVMYFGHLGEVLSPDPYDPDGDGHITLFDKCPDEPEDYDCDIDSDGCPETERTLAIRSECESRNKPMSFSDVRLWEPVLPQ